MVKKQAKKQPASKATKKTTRSEKDKIAAEIKKVTDELVKVAKDAKKKYDKIDDKTKKQIIAGVAGTVALIAGAIGVNKLRKK